MRSAIANTHYDDIEIECDYEDDWDDDEEENNGTA